MSLKSYFLYLFFLTQRNLHFDSLYTVIVRCSEIRLNTQFIFTINLTEPDKILSSIRLIVNTIYAFDLRFPAEMTFEIDSEYVYQFPFFLFDLNLGNRHMYFLTFDI